MPRLRHLTDAAFVLLLATLIARVLTSDALRDIAQVLPGGLAEVRHPGPACALVLDALLTLPALLILARHAIDPTYRLTRRWSAVPLFALSIWAVASTTWAVDKFAALVTGVHWLSAAAVFWSAAQLCRSWSRFRIVVAMAFGLLMIVAVQAGTHEFIDKKADLEFFQQNRGRILAEHGMAPDSFSAKQFEQKVTNGELIGLFTSANSTAAVTVLLLLSTISLGLQFLETDRTHGRATFTIVAIAASAFVLALAKSKTSIPTSVFGAVALAAYMTFAPELRRIAGRFFTLSVVTVVAAMGLVVALGIHNHGLFKGHFSNSLDFRWKYWTAAAGIVRDHPLLGVGVDNFGLHYLAHRLPEAAESIKDPHNLFVRFASELGLIGLLLGLAAVTLVARDMTVSAGSMEVEPRSDHVGLPATIAAFGVVLAILIHVDFDLPLASQSLEVLRYLLYLAVMLVAMTAASVRSVDSWFVDDRPAPILRAGVVIGVFLLIVHNCIDFSLFESNVMPLVTLLAGATVGSAPLEASRSKTPATIRRLIPLALAGLTWLTIFAGVAMPVLLAESSVSEGDEMIRTTHEAQSPAAATRFRAAAVPYHAAVAAVPYNADYRMKAARAEARAGDVASALADVAEAVRLNPRLIEAYLLDADIRLSTRQADAVVTDYDRVVALSPTDVTLRLRYADALDRLGRPAEAEYRAALAANDGLPVDEPQRLSAERVQEIRRRLDRSR